jgi:xanthine dehydrogenase YagR molybdenum-binding subunit
MAKYIGKEISRVDGVAKVTGQAKYAAEFQVKNLAYGFLVTSTVPRGRIVKIDSSEAEKQPGVIRVLTHLNTPKIAVADAKPHDPLVPDNGMPFHALADDRIYFNHQPIALVLAESYEQARFASRLVKVTYEPEKHLTTIKKEDGSKAYHADTHAPRGDAAKAFQNAKVKLEAEYTIPIHHHNPMELQSSIALWEGDKVILFEKTQSVMPVRNYVAAALGLPVENVLVISPFVGGAFGNGLRPNQTPTLSAVAAREIKRPVKIVFTRQQMVTTNGYRPDTWQKISLGADEKGKLEAMIHEIVTSTSSFEDYTENSVLPTRALYACPNLTLDYKVAKTDLSTPQSMRAPGAVSKMFALECALDELAHKLKIDPVELRLVNYAEKHPDTGKPWSSKELRECYRVAAEKFGWAKRNPEPRSMRDGRLLVGWGMATAYWGAYQVPASVSIALKADGNVLVQSSASDIGPGTYTVITMIVAEYLGIAMEKVKFELGQSNFPVAPHQGGSWTTASVGSAAIGAARAVQKKLGELLGKISQSPFNNVPLDRLVFENGAISIKDNPAEKIGFGEILKRSNLPAIVELFEAKPSPERDKYALGTHGAQFVEIKIDEEIGRIRVTRITEATACGRVINLKASHSQEMGGAIWGVGMALQEATEIDHRYGRIMNPNLAGYHFPVNADIHEIKTDFVPEEDRVVNELGVKGMGEVGIVGIPAAIANAVFHATGKRIRNLPITPDKLL